jgi:SAD/SRA domain
VYDAKVHTNKFAGITGSKTNGAFSVVLSGGYEDDLDQGDVMCVLLLYIIFFYLLSLCRIYTGTGKQHTTESWSVLKKLLGGRDDKYGCWGVSALTSQCLIYADKRPGIAKAD